MDIDTFFMHFLYIGGFFSAGFALGMMFKESISTQLNKLFKHK